MYHKEFRAEFPKDVFPGAELELNSVHFNNKILVQVRYNGEMDTTYEVFPRGLEPLQRPLAGFSVDEDEYAGDHMSDWQVICRLGDSNDAQLPVICTQIGELYRRVIMPSNVDGLYGNDEIQSRGLVITLSSKMWKNNEKNFDKLIFVLGSIRQMYISND